jgi:hypothetical protein
MPIHIYADGAVTADSAAEAAEFLRIRSGSKPNDATPGHRPQRSGPSKPKGSWADYLQKVGDGWAKKILHLVASTNTPCSLEFVASSLGISVAQARGNANGLRSRAQAFGFDPSDVIVWTGTGYRPGKLLGTRGVGS